jgi:hypothetical protein
MGARRDGRLALGLSAFSDFAEEARKWIVHLGNVGAPLTGVILVVKRQRIDIPALFDSQGATAI